MCREIHHSPPKLHEIRAHISAPKTRHKSAPDQESAGFQEDSTVQALRGAALEMFRAENIVNMLTVTSLYKYVLANVHPADAEQHQHVFAVVFALIFVTAENVKIR